MQEIFLWFIAGVVLTGFLAFVLHRFSMQKEISARDEKLRSLQQLLDQLTAEKNVLQSAKDEMLEKAGKAESRIEILQEQYEAYVLLQKKFVEAQQQVATLTAQVKYTREKLDNQQNDILRLREQFRLEFGELAQKILDDQSRKFTESNELKMKQIIDPLKANLSEFKQKVEDTYDKESKERFTLGKEVQRLVEMSRVVSLEANNLTTALKGNNKMQGNWGEMILESLLENSGLVKGREYMVQDFIKDTSGNIIKDEHGKGLQPDITIFYPDQRKIIIDSKVSLVAWEQLVSSEDTDEQKRFMIDHIRSIRQHIEQLSRKNYPKYALALDYVLLFIPIEPAFLEAVKTDTQLWKFAYDKKILLVSPTNLFSVLKIIADLWKVEQQNRNAIEIAEKAGALYDKFYGFIENLELVGRKLNDATSHYVDAFKQITSGRGNIIGRVEELKKMGAEAKKQLPDRLFIDE